MLGLGKSDSGLVPEKPIVIVNLGFPPRPLTGSDRYPSMLSESCVARRVANLVAVRENAEEQREGGVDGEQGGVIVLLAAVGAVLTRIQKHRRVRIVVARIELKSDLCIGPSVVLQVHNKADKTRAFQVESHILDF